MALRGVIFDYGMVLSAPADPIAHNHLVQVFDVSPESFEKAYWAHRHAYDEGQFDGAGFWERCASDLDRRLSSAQIAELIATDIQMWSVLNQPMVDWAHQVHAAGFRTGILSNIGKELAETLALFEWAASLDHNTWSYSLKMAKPDPAIFHHALDGLGTSPEETLFIDDRQENVMSAQAVGMKAVVFRDLRKLHSDLEDLSLAPLLPALPIEEAA